MAAAAAPLTPQGRLLSFFPDPAATKETSGNVMARKPRDFDAELHGFMDNAKKVRS
jgi:hypothetical protein